MNYPDFLASGPVPRAVVVAAVAKAETGLHSVEMAFALVCLNLAEFDQCPVILVKESVKEPLRY